MAVNSRSEDVSVSLTMGGNFDGGPGRLRLHVDRADGSPYCAPVEVELLDLARMAAAAEAVSLKRAVGTTNRPESKQEE